MKAEARDREAQQEKPGVSAKQEEKDIKEVEKEVQEWDENLEVQCRPAASQLRADRILPRLARSTK